MSPLQLLVTLSVEMGFLKRVSSVTVGVQQSVPTRAALLLPAGWQLEPSVPQAAAAPHSVDWCLQALSVEHLWAAVISQSTVMESQGTVPGTSTSWMELPALEAV